jgi:hypothetical protein
MNVASSVLALALVCLLAHPLGILMTLRRERAPRAKAVIA